MVYHLLISPSAEWKIFGSALALSHSCLSPTQRAEHSPSSLLKGVRSFCIAHSSAETQSLLPEVGNHKHVASTLHKSGGWGNKGSLVLCVLNNTHQTPAPTPNSTRRHPRCKRKHKASIAPCSAVSSILREGWSTRTQRTCSFWGCSQVCTHACGWDISKTLTHSDAKLGKPRPWKL